MLEIADWVSMSYKMKCAQYPRYLSIEHTSCLMLSSARSIMVREGSGDYFSNEVVFVAGENLDVDEGADGSGALDEDFAVDFRALVLAAAD